jgi:transcription elongation GreA/GreB family factor
MNLLEHQVTQITNKIAELHEEINNLKEVKKTEPSHCKSDLNQGFTDCQTSTNVEIIQKLKEIKDLEYILSQKEVVTSKNCDFIDIGTTFDATINYFGQNESGTFTLVDYKAKKFDPSLVSIYSEFGNAVYMKKTGASFSFKTDKSVISGVIDKIHTIDNIVNFEEDQKVIVK